MEQPENKGVIFRDLARNAKTIRNDRAEAILEDLEITFERKIKDLELKIKRLKRDRKSLSDMSPDNVTSIIRIDDFNAEDFYESYRKKTLEIRNLLVEYRLMVAHKKYLLIDGDSEAIDQLENLEF